MEPLLSKSEFTNSRKLRNLLGLSAVYGCFFVLFNWSPGVTSARLPNKICYYIMWFSTTRMYINSVLNIFTGFQMTTLRHWKAYKNTIWNAICHLFFFLEIDISHNFTLVSFFPPPPLVPTCHLTTVVITNHLPEKKKKNWGWLSINEAQAHEVWFGLVSCPTRWNNEELLHSNVLGLAGSSADAQGFSRVDWKGTSWTKKKVL